MNRYKIELKEILRKNLIKDTKLIHINKKSIENIKNIKFETIINGLIILSKK